jgi:hypothetical protein
MFRKTDVERTASDETCDHLMSRVRDARLRFAYEQSKKTILSASKRFLPRCKSDSSCAHRTTPLQRCYLSSVEGQEFRFMRKSQGCFPQLKGLCPQLDNEAKPFQETTSSDTSVRRKRRCLQKGGPARNCPAWSTRHGCSYSVRWSGAKRRIIENTGPKKMQQFAIPF